jgi:membrane fusion protein, multidrug efflux system
MSEIPKAETFQGADPVSEAAATTAASTTARRLPAARLVLKRGLLALAGLVGTAAVAYWGHGYWTTGRYLESTNDAYVKADYTTIAPKVSGYIADVLVKDNESVKAGQVLARIDDRDFRAALDEALAKVEASQAAIRNLDAQVALQQSMIAQAKAQVVATKATLVFAKADAERYHDLVKTGAGTLQRSQQTQSLRDATVAQLQRDEAALERARAGRRPARP